ncbi:thiol protease/hemagglutinin PrtT [Bacteroides sp.]
MRRNLFWLFLFSSSLLWADNVTVSRAEQLARSFWGNRGTTRSAEIQLEYIWNGESVQTRTDAVPAFHVFNRTSEGGFIIISGDDIVAPVLAYSNTGKFEVENMPSNLQDWMGYYREQINWAREQNMPPSASTVELWSKLERGMLSDNGEEEVLMETALWNQGTPYNKLCPNIDNVVAPTGCVATALAIVMKYNRWPDKGNGATFTYTTRTYERKISATYSTTYDWDNMPDVYEEGAYTTTQANQVGRLMYHCGVFSQMDYTPKESGAYTPVAARGMIDYMKYDKSLTVLEKEWYTDAEWNALLKSELNAGRLVIYGGSNSRREGHQFVFDGYKADRYHVNWGWGGMANGYYLLSTLEPDQQGIGGNTGGGFSIGQNAVIGIKKAETGSSYRDMLAFFKATSGGTTYAGLSTTETDFLPNTRFDVTAAFIANYGVRDFSGVVALALVDEAGNRKEFISNEYPFSKLEAMDGSNGSVSGSGIGLRCTITATPQPGDRIWLMYKANDVDSWEKVKGGRDVTTEIIVRKGGTGVTRLEQANTPDITIINNDNRIMVKSSVALTTITVYDIEGRVQREIECPETTEVEFSCEDYLSGMYILRAITTEGVSSGKFIKK